VRVPSPSLPSRLHKEKGDETLIFIAFLLLQISLLLSTSIKSSIWRRSQCGFDSPGPARRSQSTLRSFVPHQAKHFLPILVIGRPFFRLKQPPDSFLISQVAGIF
jgi:hypothetical protein